MTTATLPHSPAAAEAPALDAIADVQRRIADTFQRCGDVDWRRIHVRVDDDRALLTGVVTTSFQRWAAEFAALDSPGIRRVDNRLVVWPKEQRDDPEVYRPAQTNG